MIPDSSNITNTPEIQTIKTIKTIQTTISIRKGKEESYRNCVQANRRSTWGKGILEYLHKWASLMEEEIKKGRTVEQVASKTQLLADNGRISSYMNDLAVEALADFWVYGEELRVWHNKSFNYTGRGVYSRTLELNRKPCTSREETEELLDLLFKHK